MTTEELLMPRYKVIAPWPGMADRGYCEGQIITLDKVDEKTMKKQSFIHSKQGKLFDAFFNFFPHLFKKLEWWEDRKPEDMPEYLKWRDTGVVCKPIKFRDNYFFLSDDPFFAYSFAYVDIATAAEYQDYINKKNNDDAK